MSHFCINSRGGWTGRYRWAFCSAARIVRLRCHAVPADSLPNQIHVNRGIGQQRDVSSQHSTDCKNE